MSEPPYLIEIAIKRLLKYNPHYGDNRICKCEHKFQDERYGKDLKETALWTSHCRVDP